MAVKATHEARVICYSVARDGSVRLTVATDHDREVAVDIPAATLASIVQASDDKRNA